MFLSANRTSREGSQLGKVESEHISGSDDDEVVLSGGSSRAGAMRLQSVFRAIRGRSDEKVEPALKVSVPAKGPGDEDDFMPASESGHCGAPTVMRTGTGPSYVLARTQRNLHFAVQV